MKKIIYSILFLLLTGCGNQKTYNVSYVWENEDSWGFNGGTVTGNMETKQQLLDVVSLIIEETKYEKVCILSFQELLE